jgi:hypothetical protein
MTSIFVRTDTKADITGRSLKGYTIPTCANSCKYVKQAPCEIKETGEDRERENVSLPRNTMKFKLRLHKRVIDKCHAPLCWSAGDNGVKRVCCPSQM